MQCPVCRNVELRIADRQGVEIDFCPQCRGVWLDKGELDKIIARSAAYDDDAMDLDDAWNGKAKRGAPVNQPYRRDDGGDYRRPDYDYRDSDYDHRKPKKKSLLGELFDIFD